jgi:hypothetical protein
MCADRAGSKKFFYDNQGNIYKDENGTISKDYTASASSGNGIAYLGEDRNLYYALDKSIGRLTEAADSTGTYYDAFLETEGGAPTNTHCMDLEEGSSQYASVADHADQSLTGDISLEAYGKLESLPATNEKMVLISKWNETGNQRSYKLEVSTSSNYFGDGSDSDLTISSNTNFAPIDSVCSGTVGTNSLTATNVNFSTGQEILIYQAQGTNAGVKQFTKIQSYTAGTITTEDNLDITFASSGSNHAFVMVVPNYDNVTLNAGKTLYNKPWSQSTYTGGITIYKAKTAITINGRIEAYGGYANDEGQILRHHYGGYLGATTNSAARALQGEGTLGVGTASASAYGSAGGGGYRQESAGQESSGGGGGHATSGYTGGGPNIGAGGNSSGSADLTTLTFGGGGGGGGGVVASNNPGGGGGGGIVILIAPTITIHNTTGFINCQGSQEVSGARAGGGAGAGGSVLIQCQTADLGTNRIDCMGGPKLSMRGVGQTNQPMGNGADGRIHVDYYTSYTGTATYPSIDSTQDNTLGTTDGYVMRLVVSSNGTAYENYEWDITAAAQALSWHRYQVTWDASASTAIGYLNGVSLGEKYGALTAIYNSTASFYVGADAQGNYWDGKVDDVRLWSDVRTESELVLYKDQVLVGNEANLISYYKLDNDYQDGTALNHDLTGSGTPVFSTDVPFSGVTTRGDEDQASTGAGNTYAVPTAINEGATHRQTFIPAKDPQKSISININTIGTGNWTITIHDGLNRSMASKTVAVAQLTTGTNEFVFDNVWRPIMGASYHFHITSSVNDGIAVSTANNDLEGTTSNTGGQFHTYYQILVEDEYHMILPHLNFLAICNERYLATYEAGNIYNPHELTLPSNHRTRCLGYWREYLAIGTWLGTSITDYDRGRIFFWDGTASTYNFYIDVPEGGINAMYGAQGTLYFVAGYKGTLMKYQGGDKAVKVDDIPELADGEYCEIAPGAMNMWGTILYYGLALNTDSTNLHQGVYGYGALTQDYPDSLGFDYPLSIGDQQNTGVKIGTVFPAGQSLYVGWQNGNAYGIDKITATNDPYSTSTIELLIADLGILSADKYPLVFKANFEPLESGQSITLKMKNNRESSWKILATQTTANTTECRGIIHANSREIQLAADITNTSNSVSILGFSLEVDDASGERSI